MFFLQVITVNRLTILQIEGMIIDNKEIQFVFSVPNDGYAIIFTILAISTGIAFCFFFLIIGLIFISVGILRIIHFYMGIESMKNKFLRIFL
jgi:hypothetical protein